MISLQQTTQRILAILALSASLSHAALSPTNGYYTAQPGSACTTVEAYASTSYRDITLLRNMFRHRDWAALTQMEQDKRLVYTRAGVPVFVEQRIELDILVRPQGHTGTVWMPNHAVECPKAVASQPTKMPTKSK